MRHGRGHPSNHVAASELAFHACNLCLCGVVTAHNLKSSPHTSCSGPFVHRRTFECLDLARLHMLGLDLLHGGHLVQVMASGSIRNLQNSACGQERWCAISGCNTCASMNMPLQCLQDGSCVLWWRWSPPLRHLRTHRHHRSLLREASMDIQHASAFG